MNFLSGSAFLALGKENMGNLLTEAKWWAGINRSFAFLS